ncbi:MAG: hypothetical protein NVS2B7_28470 [Herpetosiphon sp.]
MNESNRPLSVFQFKIVLRHVTPMVWRRVVVAGDTTIAHLHRIMQLTMGWQDVHLHAFRVYGKEYSSSSLGGLLADDPDAITIASLRLRPRERFSYI